MPIMTRAPRESLISLRTSLGPIFPDNSFSTVCHKLKNTTKIITTEETTLYAKYFKFLKCVKIVI